MYEKMLKFFKLDGDTLFYSTTFSRRFLDFKNPLSYGRIVKKPFELNKNDSLRLYYNV